MYTNILVPVSFEEDRNVKAALEVAQALGSAGRKITCVHVVEQLPVYATEFVPAAHMETARSELNASLQSLVADIDNAHAVVIDGSAANAILQFAETHGADLIIMASHRPGMADYLLGSTAARVVRHATCAVHVIR
ncbi:MAG: universal stress protein [Pseudomonadota bacterium]